MINSGLSIHITNNKNDFAEYYPYEESKYTQQITYSLGEGYVYLKSQNQLIKLAVCFVLNATHWLLSTGQLINAGFPLQQTNKALLLQHTTKLVLWVNLIYMHQPFNGLEP